MEKLFQLMFPSAVQVIPYLYIGPWEARNDVGRFGIKHIISVLTAEERQHPEYPAWIPASVSEHGYIIDDTLTAVLKPVIDDTLSIIHTARIKGEAILVHCGAGKSRSASIIIAYLMVHERMRMADAIKLLKSVRPIIAPNASFLEQLEKLDYGK